MGRTSTATRLERLEARTHLCALPTGPYTDKPPLGPEWWAAYRRRHAELWGAASYVPWAGPDREHATRDNRSAPDGT
jgi:hypothetical protein